ncbi:MAG: pyridoxal phosphate-dependent aminotransferase [Candidatus Eremiobacteraeota bacterium]|nr:pyridoxal phosphate-dependent aminotransferase [Candidatus Eremiobacteraeota bacterium]
MSRFTPNGIISLVGETPRFDLGGSYGPNLRVDEVLGEVAGALRDVVLGYGSAQGDRELREAIAAMNDARADDVVVTIGGVHALFLTAFTLCAPGDDVVLTTPVFPPARSTLEAIGATIREVRLAFERGYTLDINEFANALTKETKLVSLASPQNPSGVAIPLATLQAAVEAMNRICPRAYMLLDDTYRFATYGDEPVAPSAGTLGPRVVTVASLSKCHGAPGVRTGWAIVRDPSLREQLVLGKFNTAISNSPVEEFLALRILSAQEQILQERRAFLAASLARTQAWIDANAFALQWVRPDAGAICCVRLRPEVFDDGAVLRFYELLANAGILVSRGSWFGESDRVFRVGFGHLAPSELDSAYESFTGVLTQLAGETA